MSSWFGRRRDKDKNKTLKTSTSRSKSVDAPPRLRHSPLVLPSSPPSPPPPPPAALPPRTTIRFASTSLSVIPASNAPSRAASPAPPVLPLPVLPPPMSLTFRPTASNRPGSSSGFRRVFAGTRPRGTGSTPSPPPPPRTQPRRPATSSGAPAAESFLRQSLSRYGVGSFASLGTSSSFSIAPPSSSASPSPSHSPPASPLPPRSQSLQQPQPSPTNLRKAARLRGFILKDGKRHHPRPREEAPYPRNYERKVLDHDVWELAFSRQLAGSNTFHKFPSPPARVLDLGCGTGSWILDSAREWPNTLFTGLDLVPIQPDPATLGLDARVTWITANFLEPLPFADGAFSFVHVRRVARGVPEHRWGSLMEEVARVLEPGGALEVIEEDLFFPGTEWVGGEDDDDNSGSGGSTRSRSGSTAASQKTLPKDQQQHHNGCTRPHRPRGHTVLAEASDDASSNSDHDHDDHCPAVHAHSPCTDPRDHSLLARAYEELHAARFINLAPLSVLHSALVQYFRNVRSQPPLQLSFPPRPSDICAASTTSTSALTPTPLLRPAFLTPTSHKHLLSFDAAAPGDLLPQGRCCIDATSLHLHLSARVTEVLACAEEMWDTLQQQEKQQQQQKQKGGEGGGLGNGAAVAEGTDAPTREEWDDALARFEMDMQDRIALGPLLTGRLAWHEPRLQPPGKHQRGAKSGARAAFDEAVRRWEQEQQRLRRRNGAAVPGGPAGAARKGVPLSRRLRVFIAWKDL